MRIRHRTVLILSGSLWMGIGSLLLLKGVGYLFQPTKTLFLSHLQKVFSSDFQIFSLFVLLSIFLGWFKGKFALSKAAHRLLQRLFLQPDPCPILSVYPRSYFFLLFGMCFMGVMLKWLPIHSDVKAIIDMTVGFALASGSSYFFRTFTNMRKNIKNKTFF